jgi:hypothetical protein
MKRDWIPLYLRSDLPSAEAGKEIPPHFWGNYVCRVRLAYPKRMPGENPETGHSASDVYRLRYKWSRCCTKLLVNKGKYSEITPPQSICDIMFESLYHVIQQKRPGRLSCPKFISQSVSIREHRDLQSSVGWHLYPSGSWAGPQS